MVVAGVAVAILGPYALYQLSPHVRTVSSEEVESGPPGIDLDISEVDTLPDSLRDGAMVLLTAELPQPPDSIMDLPEAGGPNVLQPVSEAVEETRPVLSWSAEFGAPPYSVSIVSLSSSGGGDQVVARAEGIQNTSWMVLTPLRRGGEYTWQVAVAGVSEQASFRVMDQGQVILWKAMQAAHRNSHLLIGLVAQQLGLLATAQREYAALTKAYPDSETAALLLNNVTELRDQ